MEGTLEQLLAGALRALNEAGCSLIGGHTCEGAEVALGFSVNGVIRGGAVSLMGKGGAMTGDALVLTKPVSIRGSGLLSLLPVVLIWPQTTDCSRVDLVEIAV